MYKEMIIGLSSGIITVLGQLIIQSKLRKERKRSYLAKGNSLLVHAEGEMEAIINRLKLFSTNFPHGRTREHIGHHRINYKNLIRIFEDLEKIKIESNIDLTSAKTLIFSFLSSIDGDGISTTTKLDYPEFFLTELKKINERGLLLRKEEVVIWL